MNDEQIEIAPCSNCGRETKHTVLYRKETAELDRSNDGELLQIGENKYVLLECCGCESIRLRHFRDYYPDPEPSVNYYPPPLLRQMPKWVFSAPEKIILMLWEVYTALAANSPRLAVMGARTVIDMVMLDKIGDVGSFGNKLKQLEGQGLISRVNRDYLVAALDTGSAAIHRGHVPSNEDVHKVMDIVENLIQAVYDLPKAAQQLRDKTPPRVPKKEMGRE